MEEKDNKNSDLPIFPFNGEFDLVQYRSILDHCLSNEIASLRIETGLAISAVYRDQVFDLCERYVFSYEIKELLKSLLSAQDAELVRSAGRLQVTEYIERKDGREVPYSLAVEHDLVSDHHVVDVVFLKFETNDAGPSELIFKSEFAGSHDGSIFKFHGLLDKDSLDNLLRWAGDHKASDITITPDQYVMADIGGKLCRITDRIVSPDEVANCVNYIYGENGMGEVLAGNDLDPSHEVRTKGERIRRYRVNITPGRVIGGVGPQITIRTLPSSPIPVDKLGLPNPLLANTRPQNGIVFICGPTGSGKSTTMSSIIRMIVERPDANEKVLEYSSPIEYVYDDVIMPSSTVFQTHVGRHLRPRETGGSIWAYAARNSLRRKPTIIVLGEARDAETIEEAINISQEGHLTYTTMHTNSVAETINRAINVFPFEARDRISIDLMGALRMVVVQILVPKIGGGKVACREYMVFDPKTRARFMKTPSKNWPILIQRMLAEQQVVGQTMLKSALELLANKEITMETFEKIAEAGGNG